ncbi:MAG TPA: (d)CMP kinase [Nitrospirae bacterium]|nr:cytidylate kinase [bacterium BMS3Abin06]HDH13061.1 (d)CMP kinase [Nitrospirota bacterium]HDZ01914.1 (d)CMP kinase [Nitrospirota bacterium]
MKNIITIDGPSGSGKGTVSRLLAKKLGYKYLDTGALYRAVAWKVKREKADPDNEDSLNEILKNINIDFRGDMIFIDGADVTSEIRTNEIGELSSRVSARPEVRAGLFSMQRESGLQGKVVIEGRDTGTAIFPEAENKFFLDATLEERARRRFEELKDRTPGISLEKTIEDIKKRDLRDSSRENSPLMKTKDMIYIDSTNLNIEEVVAEILKNLR